MSFMPRNIKIPCPNFSLFHTLKITSLNPVIFNVTQAQLIHHRMYPNCHEECFHCKSFTSLEPEFALTICFSTVAQDLAMPHLMRLSLTSVVGSLPWLIKEMDVRPALTISVTISLQSQQMLIRGPFVTLGVTGLISMDWDLCRGFLRPGRLSRLGLRGTIGVGGDDPVGLKL